jgi:ADP-heptose:LPS heptosyltransferase
VARIFAETLYPWIPEVREIQPASILADPAWSQSAKSWLLDRGWQPGERLLAIHPGAGSPAKRWPIENYELVANKFLEEKHGSVVIIEGPAEPGLGKDLARRLAPLKPFRAECLSLMLLAGVLSHCRLYLGNDSGISHLAAGLGIPSVVLFMATSADQWAPPGSHVKAVSGDNRIPPSAVWSALGF